MAETKQQTLTRLKQMRDSGILSTSVDGVVTTFQTPEQLQKHITRLERELGQRSARRRFFTPYMGHR